MTVKKTLVYFFGLCFAQLTDSENYSQLYFNRIFLRFRHNDRLEQNRLEIMSAPVLRKPEIAP